MLKIQSNSRQIPSIEEYTASKKYHDLLYGVLQEMSYSEDIDGITYRFVNKSDMNMQQLGDRINLTRQTISNKLKSMEKELHLIEEDKDNKRYKLNTLASKSSTLIPYEVLRKMNNALSHNCISIYVYLLNRFIANQENEFQVTMSQMKTFIGLSTTTTSNNEVITDILDVLRDLGFLKWGYRVVKDKKHIWVYDVTNRPSVKERC